VLGSTKVLEPIRYEKLVQTRCLDENMLDLGVMAWVYKGAEVYT
jgi:hypothetical protein